MARETKIVQGIKVTVDPEMFADCDVQEDIENGRVITAIKSVVGDKAYQEAKESLADKNGRTSLNKIAKWYEKCAEQFGVTVKN